MATALNRRCEFILVILETWRTESPIGDHAAIGRTIPWTIVL
jgi:hypothetical protein